MYYGISINIQQFVEYYKLVSLSLYDLFNWNFKMDNLAIKWVLIFDANSNSTNKFDII